MKYDLIIIGSGPAGLSAAVYASRYNLRFIIIGKDMGSVSETGVIENYLGIYPVVGMDLINKFIEHAKQLGIEIISEVVKGIEKNSGFTVKTAENEYTAKTVIYAPGGIKRRLGLEEEEKFIGKGVSYCATCDAALYKDKVVGVVGGANAAVNTALLLSEFAKKVYLIYRREKLRAFPRTVEKLEKKQNVEVIYNGFVKKINGKDFVESVVLEDKTGERELALNGIFVEFGYVPNSYFADKLGVELTDDKRIAVKDDMSTNINGFFAAGDVTSGSNRFDQIITASAEGAIAASSAYKMLMGLK